MSVLHADIVVLNTEPGRFSDKARAALGKLVHVEEEESDRDFLLENINNYDGLFICLRNIIDAELLERGDRLKFIVTPTTGLNHIDMEAANSKGVTVLSLRGETTFLETITATAELTWGLLLSLIRKIPSAYNDVLSGCWRRDNFYGTELSRKTLGVIGYGRLGKMVAHYGKAFGMKVISYDKKLVEPSDVEFVDLHELMAQSDVITIHLALNDDTRGLIDEDLFSVIKPGAIFLNTARGEIVDESAMLKALMKGVLSGAAIDVISDEVSNKNNWLKNNALRLYASVNDNLIIVPHIGGVTTDSVENTNMFMINKLGTYLQN